MRDGKPSYPLFISCPFDGPKDIVLSPAKPWFLRSVKCDRGWDYMNSSRAKPCLGADCI